MLYVLLIAVGLSMDAFGVSIALGCATDKKSYRVGILSSALFGAFQAFMPIGGYAIGTTFKSYISHVDHWIAFFLLFIIGYKMINDQVRSAGQPCDLGMINLRMLFSLAIATSIDALIVGMSMTILEVPFLMSISVIGMVTFLLCLGGIVIGMKCSGIFNHRVGILGGVLLMVLGLKVLTDHLLL